MAGHFLYKVHIIFCGGSLFKCQLKVLLEVNDYCTEGQGLNFRYKLKEFVSRTKIDFDISISPPFGL